MHKRAAAFNDANVGRNTAGERAVAATNVENRDAARQHFAHAEHDCARASRHVRDTRRRARAPRPSHSRFRVWTEKSEHLRLTVGSRLRKHFLK